MRIVIEFYIFVCLTLLLFDIIFIIFKNFRGEKYNTLRNKYFRQIKKEILNYNLETGFSDTFKTFLMSKTANTKNLVALQHAIEHAQGFKAQIQAEVGPYIFSLVNTYATKKEFEKAFYAYVVSKMDFRSVVPDQSFYVEFIKFLDSDSLYTFSNTMDAFYHFGDPYVLMQAVKKADEKAGFYHNKLLSDGLFEFAGDTETLKMLMLSHFHHFSVDTKTGILKYFRQKGLDVSDFCLQILEERTFHEEVVYESMRYFTKYPNPKSKEIFLSTLNEDNASWVEQLLCIQALRRYNDTPVREAIKSKITSRNWNVRMESVSFLHEHKLCEAEIEELLQLQDKYTNDALLYYYTEDELEPFITKTIRRMAEEQEKEKTLYGQELVEVGI